MSGIGETAGGRYRLIEVLGRGGTSTVYLGEDEKTGERVAVKVIGREKLAAAEKHAALTECRMMEKLYHPALPHIHRVWEDEDHIYVVMDYVEGVPLDELLRREGARPQELAVEWGKELCRALVYLHSFRPPVIYRDMKPSNIILQKNGKLKLVDFGTAREFSRKKRHDTMPLGTPGYAAPEQYKTGRQSDERTDIYCLGVTLYHILTGHDPSEPPFRICSILEWNPALSPSLDKIIKKCTAVRPGRRYQSCGEVLAALESFHERDRERGHLFRGFRQKSQNRKRS